jgi:hypothetical protein
VDILPNLTARAYGALIADAGHALSDRALRKSHRRSGLSSGSEALDRYLQLAVIVLGRLAVDQSCKRRGIGEFIVSAAARPLVPADEDDDGGFSQRDTERSKMAASIQRLVVTDVHSCWGFEAKSGSWGPPGH